MRLFRWCLGVQLGWWLTLAGPVLAEVDIERGKSLYSTCTGCHGAAAGGQQALSAPRLNHLRQVYIVAQLEKFRAGIRGGENATTAAKQMAPMAATLPDEQALLDVAAYISGLDSQTPKASVEGDSELGADYYNQFCGACHGARASGNVALNSPALAGSDDWYLVSQLRAFRAGSRGAHAQDKTGRQMRAMASVLPSEQAIADVTAFIHSLSEQRQ